MAALLAKRGVCQKGLMRCTVLGPAPLAAHGGPYCRVVWTLALAKA